MIFYPKFSTVPDPLQIGTITVGKLDKTIYVDGVTNTTIAQALAALPAGGGTVVCPDGYTEIITSPIVLGDGVAKNVLLKLGANVLLTVNITNGTDAFTIHSGSGISGTLVGAYGAGGYSGGSTIALAATASVGNIVANGDPNNQAYFLLEKIFIVANAGAALTGAGVNLSSANNQIVFRDVFVNGVPGKGVWLHNGTGGSGPYSLDNVWINGLGVAGARPLFIDGTGGHFFTGIAINGGVCNNPGSGFPCIEINGQGDTNQALSAINISNYCEDTHNTTATGIKIVDASDVNLVGMEIQLSAATSSATSFALFIDQSAANLTRSIQVRNLKLVASTAAALKNNVTGEFILTSTGFVSQYFYGYDLGGSAVRAAVGPVFSGFRTTTFGSFVSANDGLADVVIVPSQPATRKPLAIKNSADNTMNVDFDSGLTTPQITALRFLDESTTMWSLKKGAGNNFLITDEANSLDRAIFQTTTTVINAAAGANSITLNQTVGSGTTGLAVYSGGATPLLQVSMNANGLIVVNAAANHNVHVLSQNGNVTHRNFSDAGEILTLDSGATAAQATNLVFSDRGTSEWTLAKDTSQTFKVTDNVNSKNRLVLTQSASPASVGALRLLNNEQIGWRNAANSGDDSLTFNGSDFLAIVGAATQFGNGASANVTVLQKGTGSGPTLPQTVVAFVPITVNGTTYFVPVMQ